MKYLAGAVSLAACASSAAAVGAAGSCVPGLVRDDTSSDLTFRSSCGNKLDTTGPYGVFTAPDGRNHSGFVGVYVDGAKRSGNAVTIARDLMAGQDTILVTATDEHGETLLQHFALNDGVATAAAAATTTTYDAHAQIRAADDNATAATCNTCNDPEILCQSACQHPPATCDFYASCAEASLPCGDSGYALGYGLANCSKFMQRLSHFSSAGQAWIFRVMTCLQKFLIDGPLVQCGLTCDSLKKAAFSSHPACYVDSGVCDLPVADWVQLVITIRDDLLTLDTLKQAVTTGGRCLGHYLEEIGEELDKLQEELKKGEDRARVLAEMAVLEAVKKIFE